MFRDNESSLGKGRIDLGEPRKYFIPTNKDFKKYDNYPLESFRGLILNNPEPLPRTEGGEDLYKQMLLAIEERRHQQTLDIIERARAAEQRRHQQAVETIDIIAKAIGSSVRLP